MCRVGHRTLFSHLYACACFVLFAAFHAYNKLEGTHKSSNPRRIAVNPNPNLDLRPFNPESMSLLVHPKVIPYTKFENFGIIRFWVMLRTDKQTYRLTDGLEYPTHADRHSRRG